MEFSLREQLIDDINDLELITKQILENIFPDNKKNVTEKNANEKLQTLIGSFNEKQTHCFNLLQCVAEHQERAQYIRTLERYVESRDDLIGSIADQIKSIESSVTEATYQAEKKLKSVKQSEMNRIFSEDVIRFAHQISKHHSVSSSIYWQQGDPSRPYPIEANFAASNLLLSRTQPNVTHPFISQGRSTLPNTLKSTAVFNTSGISQKGFSPSPRSGIFGSTLVTAASPRGRPPSTGSRIASPLSQPKILQRNSSQQSPRFPQLMMPGQQQYVASSSPTISPMVPTPHSSFMPSGAGQSQMMINLPSNLKQISQHLNFDVQKVEQMSSESSSSSSSGDEASPNGQ